MNSSLVPLKICRVGERCKLNSPRAQTSSRWCGVVIRGGGAISAVVLIASPWFKITRFLIKSPRAAEQRDVNIHSLEYFEIIPYILLYYKQMYELNVANFQEMRDIFMSKNVLRV
ncbi:uncharacterized protein TNCV_1474131 [Trichonephila clavipes]|nr:uncharacterized protein TNCV_1474131 [Trichonephila clavipes]